MVPALSYEISRVSHYSGFYLVNLFFVYWTFTVFGLLSQTILLNSLNQLCSPNPRWISSSGLGSSYFARHYFRNRVFFLFLWVLRCFSSPRSPPIHYFTHVWINQLFSWLEFPHSDIHGLLNICFSPWLFAAYHVFLRLLVPRHSPYALSSLTYLFSKLNPNSSTSCLVYLISSIYFSMCFWWAQMESNHRPHAYQACALTIWAMSPYCRVCQLHSFVWACLVLLMYSAISCTFDID